MLFILNHFFKTLFMLLHVSMAYRLPSSGSTYDDKLYAIETCRSSEKCFKKVI